MKSFVKFRPKQSRRRQARLTSPWYAALERLEDRVLLAAPQLANPIADQSALVRTSFSFTVASDTFTDADSATLTLSTSALPAWLTFLPATNKFFGTPSASDVGSTDITVTASDGVDTAQDTFILTVQANSEPSFTIAADPAAANEDVSPQPVTVAGFATNISAGTNESGQTVTFGLTSNTNLGLFSTPPAISPTGTLTYSPAADANGTALVTFSLMDNGGTMGGGVNTSISHTFRITVNAVADIVADSLTTTEDTPVTANVILGTNGASADSFEGTATLTSVTQGAHGLVTSMADGTVTYTPNADFNGSDSFTYTVTSGSVTETATVSVTVSAVVDIVADSLTTNEDTAITANVITGASADNFEGAAVLTSVTQGTKGSVTFTSAGSVTYTPIADFNGSDSFTYTVTSGGVTETATVSVTINPIADVVADSLTTNEDAAVIANVITGTNGASADNFGGSAVLASVTQGANGVVTFTSAGTVTYTPNADFNGADSFTYTVTSGGVTETATVSITINAVADIVNDLLTTNEDTAITANVITSTSSGSADNFEGTAVVSSVTQGTSGGSVTFTSAGNVTYTPIANVSGTDSFMYTVTSGGITETATVNVTINAVNDAPSITLNTAASELTVAEDAGLTTTAAAFATVTSKGATNESTQTITKYTVTSVATTGGLTFLTAPSIDPVTRLLTFQAAANANGTATFSVTATDDGGTANSGSDTSAAQTFVITVTAVNDAPTISAPAAQTTLEDTAKVVTNLSFADVDAGIANVTVVLTATNGTLTLSDNVAGGLVAGQIAANGTSSVTITAPLAAINNTLANSAGLTYTPTLNFNGSDSLVTSINDGVNPIQSATIPVTITAVNDAPSITLNTAASELTVAEDAGLTTTAAAFATVTSKGATNESTQTITKYTVTSVATTGGLTFLTAPSIDPVTRLLTFQAAANANGTATFSVTATDDGGTANSGSDTSAPLTFVITINAVNDVPSFTLTGNPATVNEDAGLQTVSGFAANVSTGATNESGQTLTFILTPTGTTGGLTFAVAPSIDATGKLTYQSAADSNGTASFTMTLSDNGGGTNVSASQAFTISVNAVNDAPTFTLAGNPTAMSEDSGLQVVTGFASGINVGPATAADEIASQTISNFTVTAGPTTGGLTFLTAPSIDPISGTLTYQAAANANGTATFTVTLTDSGSNTSPNVNTSASKTFVITVTAVNDSPTIALPATQTTPQGTAKVITGIAFADVDAGTRDVTVTLSVAHGSLALGATTSQVTSSLDPITGVFTLTITAPLATINAALAGVTVGTTTTGLTYLPNALFFGSDSLTVTINDNGNTGGLAAMTTASASIFVTPSNGAAVITAVTPNVTYTANGTAKLRAFVVNGVLSVSVNGIAYPFYQQTDMIETLTFTGGSKNDDVNLTGLSAVLYPKLTKIVIKGGAGNDSLIGSDIDLAIPVTQTINGDAGNDTLSGGVGDDSLNGGAGTDLLIQSGDVDLTLTNTALAGGLGMDRLTGVENVSLTGGDGDNTFDAVAFTLGSVTLIGGDGKDELIGGSKNDAISGQGGDDVLTGGKGNDTISGGEGDDMLFGGLGNDLLIGGFGIDMVFGEGGNDTALGGQGGSARNGNLMKDDDGGAIVDIVVAEHINEAFKKLFAFE